MADGIDSKRAALMAKPIHDGNDSIEWSRDRQALLETSVLPDAEIVIGNLGVCREQHNQQAGMQDATIPAQLRDVVLDGGQKL